MNPYTFNTMTLHVFTLSAQSELKYLIFFLLKFCFISLMMTTTTTSTKWKSNNFVFFVFETLITSNYIHSNLVSPKKKIEHWNWQLALKQKILAEH